MSNPKYKRLLVKFSGEAVAGNDEHGIDPKILDQMATSVRDCKELGTEIVLLLEGVIFLEVRSYLRQGWIE